MTEKDLQDLIEQLSQQRSQIPEGLRGGGLTRGGLSPQEEYVKWAWNPANVFVGGNVPLAVQGTSQKTGRMNSGPGSPVGGFTPEFASQVNQLLFPNVRPDFDVTGGPGVHTLKGGVGDTMGLFPSSFIPGGNAETNAMYNAMQAEKAGYEAKTPGYRLSPEEEQIIEDAIAKRYGR